MKGTKLKESPRPSLYLYNKCISLEKVLDFFISGGIQKTSNEKRLAFLAQIDFWDWELDNLIDAIEGYEERSKAWRTPEQLHAEIQRKGFCVKHNKIEDVKYTRRSRNNWGVPDRVVEPRQDLKRVVDKWHTLLDACERRLLIKAERAESYAALNASVQSDLSKYRKSYDPHQPVKTDQSSED